MQHAIYNLCFFFPKQFIAWLIGTVNRYGWSKPSKWCHKKVDTCKMLDVQYEETHTRLISHLMKLTLPKQRI